jgi:peptidoglycan DL-endopeptidase CwlO
MKNLQKTRILSVAGLLIVAIVTGSSSFVRADTIDDQIKALESQRSQDQANSSQLGAQANDLQGQINDLQNQIASIQAQIDANAAKEKDLNNQIETAQKKLEEQRDLLSANIRSMYIEGDISPLEMIASSSNLGDFVEKQEYRDRIKDSITEMLDEIEKLKKQLSDQKEEVRRLLGEQTALRGSLAQKQGEASEKLAQTNQQKSSFDEAVNQKSSQIASLRAQQLAANRRATGGGGSQIISSGRSGGGYPDKWALAPQDSLVDSWGLYNRECVSYTAWKVYQAGKNMPYFGGRGNANQWPSTARSFGIATGSEPRAKSVAISFAGPYGHSMWVEEVLGGGKLRISEYNYNIDGQYTERIISGGGLTYIYF